MSPETPTPLKTPYKDTLLQRNDNGQGDVYGIYISSLEDQGVDNVPFFPPLRLERRCFFEDLAEVGDSNPVFGRELVDGGEVPVSVSA